MKKVKNVIFIALLMIIGCTSSKITASWKATNTIQKKYNKILVLGLIHDPDRRIQERMEEHMVGDIIDAGYTAVSALHEYGPKAFDKLDEKAALDKIKNSGFDAIITIVLLDKQKESRYISEVNTRNFENYYGFRYKFILEPGRYVTDTKYFWESNLYDMSDQSLLYSAQTQSFSENNIETMGHQYGKMIIKDMIKKKVLQLQVKENE